MFQESYTILSEGTALFAFPVAPTRETPRAGGPAAFARLIDERTGRELDAAPLADDPDLHPKGIALFATAYNGERLVRLTLDGPGAEGWRPSSPPAVHQILGVRLAGYEDWYAERDAFYGADYFAPSGPAGEAVLALKLRAAEPAQNRFAEALLEEIPFRSSLEFGCASGAMVRALRRRGVDARGVDLSPHILSKAHPDVRAHLAAGDFSLLDDLDRPVEAIIGQEVFEHLPPPEVDGVLRVVRRAVTRRLVLTVPCTPQNGLHHIDRFDDLPKDAECNPVEGHLVQATRWWWIARAIIAGFAFEEEESLRIRRRFLDAGRRWNIFVFRPVEEDGDESVLARLDAALRPSFEGIRRKAVERFIETGRLTRVGEELLVVDAGSHDPGGYLYYGPYLQTGKGRIRMRARVRAGEGAESLAPRPEDPAVWIEITSDKGTLHEEGVPAGRLAARPGEWIDVVKEIPVDGDRDVQVKVYHTGISDLEMAWPPECEFLDGGGPGVIDRMRRLIAAMRRRMRGR